MGRLMKLLGFERTTRRDAQLADVEGDTGGGNVVTAEHYQPSGDDAQPLPGDYATLVRGAGSGREQAVGWLDPANAGEAAPGEKRIYARDSEGTPVAWVHLRADGSVTVENDSGTLTLKADGDVDVSENLIVAKNTDIGGNLTVGGNAEIVGNTTVGGNTDITGNTTVGGNTIVQGVVSASGFSGLGGAPMTATAPIETTETITAGGDVSGAGVSLSTHTHTDSEGGTTSSPN